MAFITLLYSSFARFEEVCILTLDQLVNEKGGFIIEYRKGITYQVGK